VDGAFPLLAALASTEGSVTLSHLAKTPPTERLSLEGALTWVCEGAPRSAAPDPYMYIQTIEHFLGVFTETEMPRDRLWNKLSNSKKSEFIDTIGELAVALHQRSIGHNVRVEEPTGSGDADVYFSTMSGDSWWTDVYTFDVASGEASFSLGPDVKSMTTLLRRKVVHKFDSKFRVPLSKALIPRGKAGILLCALKVESQFLPSVLLGRVPTFDPSDEIWTKCPGLGLTALFTLQWSREHRCLVPWMLSPVSCSPEYGGASNPGALFAPRNGQSP